jgi:cation:H+ antiporter
MTPALAVPLLAASLAVTLAAAQMFARRLDRLGTRFGLPEALIGLLTAVAADGPEISSALVARVKHAQSASVGVLVGSNVFNLAAMIGLSALLVGSVRLPRETLMLEGTVGVLATVLAAGVLLGALPAPVAAVLLVLVLLPYLTLLVYGPPAFARLPLGTRLPNGLARALDERARGVHARGTHLVLGRRDTWLFGVDIVLIVLGSTGMVHAALSLGERWNISDVLIGVLVLAPLTSIPNAVTAVRLGLAYRGSALVSETFNSNTINLVVGIAAPALFVNVSDSSGIAKLDVAWVLGMTALGIVVLLRPRGMRRTSAILFIALYAGFVGLQLVYA